MFKWCDTIIYNETAFAIAKHSLSDKYGLTICETMINNY